MDATFGAIIFIGFLGLLIIGMSFGMGRQTAGKADSFSSRIGDISGNLAIIIPLIVIIIAIVFAGFKP